jgi:hypothetical protein
MNSFVNADYFLSTFLIHVFKGACIPMIMLFVINFEARYGFNIMVLRIKHGWQNANTYRNGEYWNNIKTSINISKLTLSMIVNINKFKIQHILKFLFGW